MKIFSLSTIIFSVVCLYLVSFLAIDTFFFSFRELSSNTEDDLHFSPSSIEPRDGRKYKFNNPRIAHKVLAQLDAFKLKNHTYYTSPKSSFTQPFLGLRKDDEYCHKHRAYIVAYPEVIFEEINFIHSYGHDSFVRTVVAQGMGNDVQPNIGGHMSQKQKETQNYDIEPYVNLFFTSMSMDAYHKIGKHFSCLSQESNHIPGSDVLSKKDSVAKATIKYAKKYENRPHCFSYDKFFPKTWILYNKTDCQDFFKSLNSPQYQMLKEERRIVYIRKIGSGSHRGKGVQPVNDEEEAELKKTYANGKKCGNITQNYIVQNYIHNPLLLNGHKFDFRMYLLIASTNPLIAYYHDGFLRVTLASYDINSDEKKVLLTNLALNHQIYDDVKGGNLYEGMDEEQLKLSQQWSFERLQNYLLENGIINDPNWLDNHLRPEFKKAMIHLVRLASPSLLKVSSIYELYGVDFMLDANLNLWFVEANSGPALSGYSQPMEKFITKMLQDHIKIVMGLMRSRMKRVINFVNKLIEEGITEEKYQGSVVDKGSVVINNLEVRKTEFRKIIRNYFEKEFEPSDDNGFMKIIDENNKGVEVYQGLISPDCL